MGVFAIAKLIPSLSLIGRGGQRHDGGGSNADRASLATPRLVLQSFWHGHVTDRDVKMFFRDVTAGFSGLPTLKMDVIIGRRNVPTRFWNVPTAF